MKKNLPSWFWAVAMLVLLLGFNLFFTPGFFGLHVRDGRIYGSLVDVLNRAAPVALLSLGMTLVIAARGVDLSVGAIMAVAGTVAACLITRPKDTPFAGIDLHGSVLGIVLFSLAVAAVCGLFNGMLVSFFELQPIVATLLLMVAGRGIAQLFSGGQIVTFENPAFANLGKGALLGLPIPIWIAASGFGFFTLLCRGTALGLFVEATGSNPTAARYAGVNAGRILLTVYVLSAVCAGVAGLIGTADIQAADANQAGLYLELDAILAVAVGGTSLMGGRFSLIGSVIGALLMQTLTTTILTRGISTEVTLVVKAAIVVAVCLLQSPIFRQWSRGMFVRARA